MKSILSVVVALLVSLPLFAQESDDGDFMNLSLITRLEANPTFSTIGEKPTFDLGMSTLASLFEGKRSNFSWCVSTLFLQAGGDYAWPYTCLGYSNTTNFLSFFMGQYTVGDFTFSLGKDVIKSGGFEYVDWDWDAHYPLQSKLWSTLACYQWGGSVTWSPLESTSFALQMTTSPFGERPFKSGLYSYSFQWSGMYGPVALLWSASALQTPNKRFDYLFSLGQRVYFSEDLYLTFDWNNSFGVFETRVLKGRTYKGSLDFSFNEKMEIGGHITYSKSTELPDTDYLATGINFHYNPIDNLRLHAVAAYNATFDSIVFNVGARWYWQIIKK